MYLTLSVDLPRLKIYSNDLLLISRYGGDLDLLLDLILSYLGDNDLDLDLDLNLLDDSLGPSLAANLLQWSAREICLG